MNYQKWIGIVGTAITVFLGLGNAWAVDAAQCEKLFQAKQLGQAFPVCHKAAKQGNINAQSTLGLMYYEGQGVPQNYAEAAKWFRKAAEQGDSSTQFALGSMFVLGDGVKKDFAKALMWYRKAADQGSADAQKALGLMYDQGKGVKKNYEKAAKWYRRAAEQGNAKAQFNLGLLYAGGDGVTQSGSAAADWLYKAGQSYLKNKDKEHALLCIEWIKRLTSTFHMTVPNAFLADKLLAQIYGKEKQTPAGKKPVVQQVVSGTGWPVAGGYVVTNHHVVAGRRNIVLLRMDGVKIPAKVVVDDATNDLVLLKPDSPKKLPPALPLANRAARVGEHVFTVGYPHPGMMGREPKLTEGIINSRTGMRNDPRVYQISVPLQGGNSGGPLLNMSGEVVGVATAKMSAIKVFKWTGDLPQNVNYAVKIAYVWALLSSVDPTASVRVLPSKKDDLARLAKRIKESVMIVIAQ